MDFVDDVKHICACGIDVGSASGTQGGVVMESGFRRYWQKIERLIQTGEIVRRWRCCRYGRSQNMKYGLARGTYAVCLSATQPTGDDARSLGSKSVSLPSVTASLVIRTTTY